MVRPVAVLAALAVMFLAAAPADAAHRPGHAEWQHLRFGAAVPGGLDASADRIVAAGQSRAGWLPPSYTWVHAYLNDGTPDPSFGETGMVDFRADPRTVVGALIQPDGRIVVAENGGEGVYDPSGPPGHLLRRLLGDGRPDPTFGTEGVAAFDLGGTDTTLTDVALQPDGRVVVAGAGGGSHLEQVTLVVARFLPDGSPDESFGSGGTTELASGPPRSHPAVSLQPDGGLILTAGREDGPVIARLTSDGRLDGTFGAGELAGVEYGDPAYADAVRRVWHAPHTVVLPDGRIRLAVSFTKKDGRPRIALLGLTADGHPDLGFGERGLALGPRPRLRAGLGAFDYYEPPAELAHGALLDARGSVLVVGSHFDGWEFRAAVRRFRAGGGIDRSFGTRGLARGPKATGGYPAFDQHLAVPSPERLVVATREFDAKYGHSNKTTLRSIGTGYDERAPTIRAEARGCRALAVRITDLTGLDGVVVRAGGRVVRRTTRKRFRVRLRRGGVRVVIRATDLAENVSTRRARLPRC